MSNVKDETAARGPQQKRDLSVFSAPGRRELAKIAGADRAGYWNSVVAHNLKRLRLLNHMTIEGLAELSGYSVPLVQQHENGRSRVFAGQVKLYAELLLVGLDEFYQLPEKGESVPVTPSRAPG